MKAIKEDAPAPAATGTDANVTTHQHDRSHVTDSSISTVIYQIRSEVMQ